MTGPIFVTGAVPGDAIKVQTLSALLRVPYGVVCGRISPSGRGPAAAGPSPW